MSWSPCDEAEQIMVLPDTASIQETYCCCLQKIKLVLITARAETTFKAGLILIKLDLLYFCHHESW